MVHEAADMSEQNDDAGRHARQNVQLTGVSRTGPVLKGVMLQQPIAEFVMTETDRLKSVHHGARPLKY